MKLLGLDLGDVWVGLAISDALGMTCRPHSTIKLNQLFDHMLSILESEPIQGIVVGVPVTLQGTQSLQTEKINQQAQQLQITLEKRLNKKIPFYYWHERLTSKWADTLAFEQGGMARTADAKQKQHAVAAAFMLQNYLDRIQQT